MIDQILDSGVCPCGGSLKEDGDGVTCSRCGWRIRFSCSSVTEEKIKEVV